MEDREKYLIKLSKSLSWLLRHNAVKQGLIVGPDGYICWDDITNGKCKNKFKNYTSSDVIEVVNSPTVNAKKRFEIEYRGPSMYIRASQGHSHEVAAKINDDLLLEKITDISGLEHNVIHGTTLANYELIKESGLKRMGRAHIHFAIGVGQTIGKSGIRSNAQVLIVLDITAAFADGIVFYRSSNDVILTADDIDPKYFAEVLIL